MGKRIFSYMKEHKFTYLLVTIFLLLDYGLAIVPTKVIQHIVDEISRATLTQTKAIFLLFVVLLVAVVCYISAYFWVSRLWGRQTIFKRELRDEMFEKIVNMRIPFFEKFRSGDMLTRFTTDVREFSELIGMGSMSLLMSVSTILFVIPSMLSISVYLSIFSVIPIIIFGIIITLLTKKFEDAIEELRESVANLGNEVLEVVDGIRVTRAYGNKKNAFKKFKLKTRDLSKKSDKIIFYSALFGRLATVFIGCSTAIIIGVGGLYVQRGLLTIGSLAAMQLYVVMLVEPMWILSEIIVYYKTGKISYGKISEILTETDDMEENGEISLDEVFDIEFKDYTFKYSNSDKNSLSNINLKIKKGATVGVVGKTGSGKTTFIRQFLRQYPVGSGEFLINGIDIRKYDRKTIEKKLGYVPQEHILFSRTVKENIRVGKNDATDEDIAVAIETASFTEDLKNMQKGIDTLIGEKGVSISGGQKQRISIARSLIKDPEILILDDSLSAVDANTERKIIRNIQKVRQGKTNIIVTHRLSAVNHADWIIVLENGFIVEEGSVEDLINNKGWYFEQYERQQLNGGDRDEDSI